MKVKFSINYSLKLVIILLFKEREVSVRMKFTAQILNLAFEFLKTSTNYEMHAHNLYIFGSSSIFNTPPYTPHITLVRFVPPRTKVINYLPHSKFETIYPLAAILTTHHARTTRSKFKPAPGRHTQLPEPPKCCKSLRWHSRGRPGVADRSGLFIKSGMQRHLIVLFSTVTRDWRADCTRRY